jgi:tetratricopeptide (TPR) repeat protein
MTQHDAAMAPLFSALKEALDAGDVRAASVARVNIACAYLQLEAPEALPAFEEALAAVRQAQNARSEGILSMAFAPYFIEQGDPARALELARRGEAIARRGRRGHRVLSLLQLARVLYQGFSDPDQAGQAVDGALAAYAEGAITHSVDQEMVLRAAAQAALAAVQAGDTERALALTRVVDPATAERIERQHPQPAAGPTPPQRQDVTRLYPQWTTRLRSPKGVDPRIAEMTRKTREMLRWDDDRARRSGSSGNAESVCAFVERVNAVAEGHQTMDAAAGMPAAPLTDDDLVFAVGLAADPGFKSLLPAFAVFELVGRGATDRALAGRCLRLAAAIGHESRDPREGLRLFQRADAALADGADDALRAEVVNEMAVCYLNLRQPQPAMMAATLAAELAERTGQPHVGRMALGNAANALLGLGRVAEALELFQGLEREQTAAGEHQMAAVTRQNIEACRAYLEQQGQ